MKQLNFYSIATVLIIGVLYTNTAVASSDVTKFTMPLMSSVAKEVPKDDDPESPDEGYECEQLFPFCEAN